MIEYVKLPVSNPFLQNGRKTIDLKKRQIDNKFINNN